MRRRRRHGVEGGASDGESLLGGDRGHAQRQRRIAAGIGVRLEDDLSPGAVLTDHL